VANFVTNRGKYLTAISDLSATTWRMMLLSTAFTSDDGLNLVDDGTTNDPLSYEIGVSGYARQSLTLTAFEDDTKDFAGLDTSDVTFTALAAGATIGWAAIYRYSTSGGTTSDTGQDFYGAYALTATPTNGGNITIAIASTSAGGAIKVGSTS
jgi:hypothetical protein